MREDCFVLVGYLAGRESCAVDTITAGPAPDNNNQAAGLRVFEAFVFVHNADVAAVDQRISHISVIEQDCAVDRRYSHSVAVVSDAGHNTFHNSFGVQNALRDILEFHIRSAETKYIRVGNGPGAQAGAHRVANYSAYACSRAAVRIQSRRSIMSFDLETDRRILVKLHHTCIITENRYAPILVELLCGRKNCLFQ